MLWSFFKRTRKSTPATGRSQRRFRPVVELMEERVVPAVVDTINFTEATYVNGGSNLNSATGLAWAPDGSNRLFVTRKGGEVRIVQDGVLLSTPFATVSPVFTNSECGLIGITFDRNYASNRFVYLFVTVSSTEQQIIRYTDSNNIGVAKTTIVAGLPTKGQNHDGGGIAIGPDNKLYWSIGDQGDGTGVDADLTTLAAKVGRANLDGTPVSDNPFNNQNSVTEPIDYIWARGFRNPFTMTFQESTGQLWVDVAGTNYEQIFKVNAGNHAGWNDFEGNQPAGFIQPEIVYRTNGTDSRTIAANGAVRNNNVATFTVTGALPQAFLQPGNRITISGVANASFNGTFNILAVPSTTTFTVAQAGLNATSSGGTAATANIGGAVTGGAFYTGTAFPAAFQGNFFFGDFNSGRIERVTFDAANNVTSVSDFATGVTSIVDIAMGPDGALYYIGAGSDGLIRRASFNPPEVPGAFVYVDFGASGFWRWSQATGFQLIHPADVETFSAGADGFVAIDFGVYGLWRWSRPTGFQQLHAADPENVAAGPDGFLYVDFGVNGFWRWSQATGFRQIHAANVETFSVGVDGFVAIDFGVYGLWRWSQATGFQQLHAANPENVVAGRDGFLYVDFAVNGLWRWSQPTGFQQLHAANVEGVAVGADGFVYIDFGASGLWRWTQATSFVLLHGSNVEGLAASADGFLYIDFGAPGLWRWSQATAFRQIHAANPQGIGV